MNKYNEIEIQTAKNLLENGYKWIAMDESGGLFAYTDKPSKLDTFWCSDGMSNCVCYYVPIFQNIRFEDKEPTSLEAIVHPQILDDAEKEYLSAVIAPFRDRVQYIEKVVADHITRLYANDICVVDMVDHYIVIHFNDRSDDMNFPVFREGAMYRGMEIGCKYTLEDLGL